MTTHQTTTLPFNKLHLSAANVRTSTRRDPAKIEAMAASIKHLGLLQNLVVSKDGKGYGVDAGGYRFEAMKLLVERHRASVYRHKARKELDAARQFIH